MTLFPVAKYRHLPRDPLDQRRRRRPKLDFNFHPDP